jgi:hypothetical protein
MARQLAWVCLAALGYPIFAPAAFAADDPMLLPPAVLTPAAESEAPQELALAAVCLERGEESAAVAYLNRYITAHPGQALVRSHLAELLWRCERLPEARAHYERFLTDAQLTGPSPDRMIHAHFRLKTIAKRCADGYSEHLHCGIALYLLALQNNPQSQATSEALLCKAVGELTLALQDRPGEARPHWYLHLVWSRLGQSQPAARSLRRAAEAGAFAEMTPAEHRDLTQAVARESESRQQPPTVRRFRANPCVD